MLAVFGDGKDRGPRVVARVSGASLHELVEPGEHNVLLMDSRELGQKGSAMPRGGIAS